MKVAFEGAARELCRFLYPCVTDHLHTKWVNLYNRKVQHSCIEHALASAPAHRLRMSVPQASTEVAGGQEFALLPFATYQSTLLGAEEKNDEKILY